MSESNLLMLLHTLSDWNIKDFMSLKEKKSDKRKNMNKEPV